MEVEDSTIGEGRYCLNKLNDWREKGEVDKPSCESDFKMNTANWRKG